METSTIFTIRKGLIAWKLWRENRHGPSLIECIGRFNSQDEARAAGKREEALLKP